ncbi:MAG TPA: iron dicitrate transport regulator FecR [Prevotella sp.]|nr:iron dicitrate transport regulator FecR [Candidatus Segatella violae]
MSNNYDINTLVSKLITGELNDDEGKALQQMAEEKPSLKDKIHELMDEADFSERYRLYQKIDAEKAKERFTASIAESEPSRHARFVWMRRIAVAAVVACAVIVTWMMMGNQTEAPVITAEMHQAIERVEQNGMNGATLIVNGKAVKVKDTKSALAQAEQLEESADIPADQATEGTLITQKDKEFWMVLDDGTYVHLNYDTKLEYPNHFVGSERKVKLTGEAYFVVAKDAKNRPFIVETANGNIHDYGTEFNVNTTKEKGVTHVVLVKGKVGVNSKHGKEYLLKPGEMATLQPGRTPNINKVDINLYTSWNTGNFFFDGCTLAELMEVISHWYNMKVEFSSDDIQEIRFTGSIDKYEPMAPTLNAIENITGLKIKASDNTITIRK